MPSDHDVLSERGDQLLTSAAVPPLQVVIVDLEFDQYGDFVAAARTGSVGLHFCVDGRSAVRLARRFRSDVWLIGQELQDMPGFDLLEMLLPHVLQSGVDPLRSGARVSLGQGERPAHSGVFMVADTYSFADEQRALAAGVAGYLVRPVTLDVIRAMRSARHLRPGSLAANAVV